jgi:hypothetical protein
VRLFLLRLESFFHLLNRRFSPNELTAANASFSIVDSEPLLAQAAATRFRIGASSGLGAGIGFEIESHEECDCGMPGAHFVYLNASGGVHTFSGEFAKETVRSGSMRASLIREWFSRAALILRT